MNTNKGDKRARRRRALQRLELQLITNSKNTKTGKIELSKKDITRINKEIELLKLKI